MLTTLVAVTALSQAQARAAAYQSWTEARNLMDEAKWAEASVAIEASFARYKFKEPYFYLYGVLAAAKVNDIDEAFRLLEAMHRLGWLDFQEIEAEPEKYAAVIANPRWSRVKAQAQKEQSALCQALAPATVGPLKRLDLAARRLGQSGATGQQLFDQLSRLAGYSQPAQTDKWLQFTRPFVTVRKKVLDHPYLVHVPPGYSAKKRTPMLVYSDGGWFGREDFRPWRSQGFRFDNPAFDVASKAGWIQVFLQGCNATGTYQYEGIDEVRQIVREVKNKFNVDDDRVCLMGFSDGATGTLRTAAFQPTPYSQFVSLSGMWYTSSPISNLVNRPLLSINGEKDDVFRTRELQETHALSKGLGAPWTFVAVPEMGHAYWPYLVDYLPEVVRACRSHRRNALRSELQWECPAEIIGSVDWLQVTQLDRESERAPWHKLVSLTRVGETGLPEPVVTNDDTAMVRARQTDNTFEVQTSRVKSFRLLVHPRMVDLSKTVRVVANGHLVFDQLVAIDKGWMLSTFDENLDRSLVWVNRIDITLNESARPLGATAEGAPSSFRKP